MLDTTTGFEQRPVLGVIGFGFGAIALLAVLVHFWVGPLAPQQQTGVSIGELAGEIAKSAARKMAGMEQPAPATSPWDMDRYLKLATAVMAGLAAVFGVAGFVCKERTRPAKAALFFAATAITFQLFTWAVLMLVGVLIIHVILSNLSLSSILGFE